MFPDPGREISDARLRSRRPCGRAPGRRLVSRLFRRQALPARRARRQRHPARGADQEGCRRGREAGCHSSGARPRPRCRKAIIAPPRVRSGRSSRRRRTTCRAGCVSARALLQVTATDEAERRTLTERAATAAYIAYQRTSARNEEADALVLLGRTFSDRKLWRPALDAMRLSLELRETAELRGTYERIARRARFPPARLFGRCRCGLAARLFSSFPKRC